LTWELILTDLSLSRARALRFFGKNLGILMEMVTEILKCVLDP
jgi:hypothetical protein